MRARWEALADSIADGDDDLEAGEPGESAAAATASGRASRVTAPVDPAELSVLAERAARSTMPVEREELVRLAELAARPEGSPGTSEGEAASTGSAELAGPGDAVRATSAATASGAEAEQVPGVGATPTGAETIERSAPGGVPRTASVTRPPSEPGEEAPPLPPPLVIKPRRRQTEPAELAELAGPLESARSGEPAGSAQASELPWSSASARTVDTARLAAFVRSVGSARPVEMARSADPARAGEVARAADVATAADPAGRAAVAPVGGAAGARATLGFPDPPEPVEELFDPEPGDAAAPPREPTLILREPEPAVPVESRTRTGDGRVVVAARTSSHEFWSEPMPIAALSDRDPVPDLEGRPTPPRDVLDFDDLDTGTREPNRGRRPDGLDELADVPLEGLASPAAESAGAGGGAGSEVPEPRDFARELRAKMSLMAQRLFQGGDAVAVPADHGPRHDHHTEIDLAALGSEPPLGAVGELEPRASPRHEIREIATSPGSWDTQVRERGLPDSGALVRGVSDAAMLLARMFAQGATGRVAFRRDEVETIVFFDRGRPVFASSNEPRDRMGELLLREGKITASQYERCQTVVAESGRRMGEILVDLGYLKRRELLPAVRRHVEDLIFSLFAWERGSYAIVSDAEPCAERIRLSRHAASLVLEGIRRKLDRTTLERLIGSTSTVIEVRDRERLGGIVHMGDLAVEERAALAAFDGQADIAHVASTAGVDVADVLPLAWGLCVLGLALARRSDAELPDESAALVGETDLAIDRERVRARWQLVGEADYFALLGVRRDATGFEIRRAYQSARRDFAADCFPTDLRRELARELDDIAHVLDEAFRVLRDDRLRQTYLANLVDP
ncbi:MAG TPA: DUF4388 domain-containing protein [Kofleriaceae bacterium]